MEDLLNECMQLLANAYHDEKCNIHHGVLNGIRARLVMIANSQDILLKSNTLHNMTPNNTATYKE